MVPAEGGPRILKLKSTWHRRHRKKILAVSLKHWKRSEGPGGGGALLLGCTAVLIHPCQCPTTGGLIFHLPRPVRNVTACATPKTVKSCSNCMPSGLFARPVLGTCPGGLLCEKIRMYDHGLMKGILWLSNKRRGKDRTSSF